METCSQDLRDELIPVMYNVLTATDSCHQSESSVGPEQIAQLASSSQTFERLVDTINHASSAGVSEGFLVQSLLRMVSNTLKWLSDRETRYNQNEAVLAAINQMKQSSPDQAVDDTVIATLSESVADFDERIDKLQVFYSEWTQVVGPYLEKTKLASTWSESDYRAGP